MSSPSSPNNQRQRSQVTEDKALDSMSRDYEVNESKNRREKLEARKLRLAELEKEQKALEEQSKLREEQNGYTSAASQRIKAPSIEETSEYGLHRQRDKRRKEESDLDPTQLQKNLQTTKLEKAELEVENTSLQYQNGALKDMLEEYELNLTIYKRQAKKIKSELEAQRKQIEAGNRKAENYKMMIKQKDDMLEAYATQKNADGDEMDDSFGSSSKNKSKSFDDDDYGDENNNSSKTKSVRLSSRTYDDLSAKFVLNGDCQDVNSQVSRLLRENEELNAQLTELRISITNDSTKSSSPYLSQSSAVKKSKSIYLNKEEVLSDPLVEMYMHEIQDSAKKEIAQYKLQAQTFEQDIAQLKANIVRLDGQVNRYKESAEFYEKAEDELKTQRRQLQRENRQQAAQIEELTTTRDHLERRLERMRQHSHRADNRE